jgi:predicted nucleic acid-binding protein
MKVFDSSAIYKIISLGRTAQLPAQYTSSLASFELGNILWKNSILASTYSQKEAIELLSVCEIVLEKMRISYADFKETYSIAAKHHITFYDATYVCLAMKLKCPLVTLDAKLAQKIKHAIDVLTVEQVIGK